jgi:alcohol dehydrogenase class IV
VSAIRFEFATAARILFGNGTVRDAASIAGSFGRTAFVVHGRSSARSAPLLTALAEKGIEAAAFSVKGEPDTEIIDRAVATARQAGSEMVIAIGGGSVIDAGKAIAAMHSNQGALLDYLEVIGDGRALTVPPAPFVAIPTTAGTGAEVTRNAVLGSPEHRVKVSLRSPLLLPRVAIVDPELTRELPPAVTATTGMDALTQLIEPFVSHKANPLTDALCREGMHRAARSLRRVVENGTDCEAREDMALASLFGGLALANAGLGAVHGFAGPLGGMFPAPHGALCAALLPHVMEINLQALRERAPDGESLRRYEKVARWLTGRADATAEESVEWVRQLCRSLDIKPLASFGITSSDIPAAVEKAAVASSMKGNPIALNRDEMAEALERSL